MKHRSPLAVFFLSLITLGIYALVWHVKTKGELNRLGANIPTSWLLIVPFANLYWLWKYCEGVQQVSSGKISAVMALVLLLVLSIVGLAILQSMFNDLAPAMAAATPSGQPATANDSSPPVAMTEPQAPVPPVTPTVPTAPTPPPTTPLPPTNPEDNSQAPTPEPPATPPSA